MLWAHNHRRAFVLCKPLDKSCLFAGFYKTSLIWTSAVVFFPPKISEKLARAGLRFIIVSSICKVFAKHIGMVTKKRTGKFHILKAENLERLLEQELHVNWSFSLQMSLGCLLKEFRQKLSLETLVEMTMTVYLY